MNQMYIIIGVAAAVVLLLLFYVIGKRNGFVKARNAVEEAFATMDVYLKKRWDLIPNVVETVKGYATHESQTLENVIKVRNMAYNGLSDDAKMDVNQQLTAGLGRLMAVAEQYPELKANTLFVNLSSQLSAIEQDIANARKYFNAVTRDYNNAVEMFPGSIVAGLCGFKKKKMFEAEAASRENVQVKF